MFGRGLNPFSVEVLNRTLGFWRETGRRRSRQKYLGDPYLLTAPSDCVSKNRVRSAEHRVSLLELVSEADFQGGAQRVGLFWEGRALMFDFLCDDGEWVGG